MKIIPRWARESLYSFIKQLFRNAQTSAILSSRLIIPMQTLFRPYRN